VRLRILYRGPVSSCNFACGYCPFSKHVSSRRELEEDRAALARFVQWLGERGREGVRFEILLTPYGEALIHPWYREAMVQLSHAEHVGKIAVQTNLSCDVEWLEPCDPRSLALWISYHPDFCTESTLLAKCRRLDALGIRHSVGVVGVREHFGAIASLRAALPESTYLWVNAYKHEAGYYGEADLAFLEGIDPLFRYNTVRYPSLGEACATGSSVVSIDGDGNLKRCHFVEEVRGNIYRDGLEPLLRTAPCPNATCHCHIGYVHLERLELGRIYGNGILERIPHAQ